MDVAEYRCMLGSRIVTLRSHYGLSIKALAMLIGMPVSRLRRVEAGAVSAKVYDFHLKRISRVFGITVDELLEGEVSVLPCVEGAFGALPRQSIEDTPGCEQPGV